MNPQSEPELKRVHAARPLCAHFEVVDDRCSGNFWHVRSGDAERCLKHLRAAGQNHACGEGHGEPLVWIDSDRVGPFDAGYEMVMLVAESSGGAVCAVHVQPEGVTLADIGKRIQVVDGAGICGADGSDNSERLESS